MSGFRARAPKLGLRAPTTRGTRHKIRRPGGMASARPTGAVEPLEDQKTAMMNQERLTQAEGVTELQRQQIAKGREDAEARNSPLAKMQEADNIRLATREAHRKDGKRGMEYAAAKNKNKDRERLRALGQFSNELRLMQPDADGRVELSDSMRKQLGGFAPLPVKRVSGSGGVEYSDKGHEGKIFAQVDRGEDGAESISLWRRNGDKTEPVSGGNGQQIRLSRQVLEETGKLWDLEEGMKKSQPKEMTPYQEQQMALKGRGMDLREQKQNQSRGGGERSVALQKAMLGRLDELRKENQGYEPKDAGYKSEDAMWEQVEGEYARAAGGQGMAGAAGGGQPAPQRNPAFIGDAQAKYRSYSPAKQSLFIRRLKDDLGATQQEISQIMGK